MTRTDKELIEMCLQLMERYITFKGTPTADKILKVAQELKNRIERDTCKSTKPQY